MMLFANEKLVADSPVEIPAVPEYPIWMQQPEPGYDAGSWLFRSSCPTNPRTVAAIMLGLLAVAFVGMGVFG